MALTLTILHWGLQPRAPFSEPQGLFRLAPPQLKTIPRPTSEFWGHHPSPLLLGLGVSEPTVNSFLLCTSERAGNSCLLTL